MLTNHLILVASTACCLSTSAFAQWTQLLVTPGDEMRSVAAHGPELLVGTAGGAVHWSNNAGNDWEDINAGLPIGAVRSVGFGQNGRMFATIDRRLYRRDIGGEWELAYQPSGDAFYSIESKGDTIIAGMMTSGGVHASNDNGSNWSDITNAMGSEYVCDVAWWNGQIIAGRFGGPVIASGDLGMNWEPVGLDSPDQVYSLAVSNTKLLASAFYPGIQSHSSVSPYWYTVLTPSIEANYIAADGPFVLASYKYMSVNGGTTWHEISPPGELAFSRVAVEDGVGYVVSGSTNILYAFDFSIWTGMSNDPGRPDPRITPNPASDFISIAGFEEIPNDATFTIRDVSGRPVKVQPATRWGNAEHMDISSVPCGIYSISVEANGISATGKFVVSR